jgi:iron complex outermembrane recepter protein
MIKPAFSAWIVIPVMFLVVRPSYADGTSASDSTAGSGQLEEIIVTAQKRAQNINEVGITVAVETGAQLREAGIANVLDLGKIVPGIQVGSAFGGVYPVFSIRGVNFNAGQLSAPSAVSIYLDEASLPYSAMTGGLLLDVARVEVLKGPQGTLFGQNATGGSINVIAEKPTEHFVAGADTEINNFGQTMVDGFVSGPLADGLLARFAATTTQFGAWQQGYYLYHGTNGDQNKAAARLLVDWTPADRIKIALNLNGNYDHSEFQQPQLSLVRPQVAGTVYPGLFGYPLPTNDRDVEIPPGLDTHEDNSFYQAALRADFGLTDNLTFTSLTDYTHYILDLPRVNQDAVVLPILQTTNTGMISSINQEFRATGLVPTANVHYVVGVNYQHDTVDEDNTTDAINYSGLPPNTALGAVYKNTNRAAGVFGNLDYEFIPHFTLTAGARYTDTTQTQAGCTNASAAGAFEYVANLFRSAAGLPPTSAYVNGGCITINDTGTNPQYLPVAADQYQSQTQNNVSWRGGLNYTPTSNTLVYGLVSRGFKAGVFPVQNTIFLSKGGPAVQEELTSYEVGTKIDLLDRKMHLNASVFYYDYQNKQFYTIVPVPLIGSTSALVNIPKASVKGADADIVARPTEQFTVRAGITFLDTKIGNYEGFDLFGQPTDFEGKQFNYAPPVSATLDTEYLEPLNNGLEMYMGAGGVYDSHTFSTLAEDPVARLPSYALLDARIGLQQAGKWRAGIWIRNITDKYYWSNVSVGGDTLYKESGMPRTFGISGSVRF